MKKIYISLILIAISFSPVMIVRAASACSPTIDRNGYCDSEGIYKDPLMSTISQNNCSSYKKKINDYCYTTCREEAKTFFPTNVPFVSVDQYDAILGGNHFRWEEIAINYMQECETTILYDKWKDKFEATMTGNDYNIARLGRHIIREEHQRDTDVDVCDYLKNDFSRYPAVTQQYYAQLSSGKRDELNEYLKRKGITIDNCDKCGGTSTGHSADYQMTFGVVGGMIGDKACPSSAADYSWWGEIDEEVREGKLLDVNFALRDNGIKTQVGFSHFGLIRQYDENASRNCEYAICVDNGKIKKPVNGKCMTNQKNYKVFERVKFENMYDLSGASKMNMETYCEGNRPYNTEDYDVENGQFENNGYALAFESIKNEVNELIAALKKCNDGGVKNINKPTVVVNYKDPVNVYSRNVQLNRVIVKEENTGIQKTPSADVNKGLMWTDCIDKTKNDINEMIKFSLKNGYIPETFCNVWYRQDWKKYQNVKLYQKISTEYKFEMPKNTYNYILKTNGEAVDSTSSKVTQEIKDNYRYVDIGYPNYPVHYTTPTGTYPINLTYSDLGKNNKFANNNKYACEYKVHNTIISCPSGKCPPTNECLPNDPRCSGVIEGLNVIYRPISLTSPFPDYTSKGRTPGENWSSKDVQDYIINNRGVKSNEVYNKAPLYSFTLDAKAIRAIKSYNSEKDSQTHKKREYNDFNLTCSSSKNGKRCMSKFLKNIKNTIGNNNASGKCLNASSGNFYSCADKPNQDKIKCVVNKSKKLECYDCNLAANKDKTVCKGSGQ